MISPESTDELLMPETTLEAFSSSSESEKRLNVCRREARQTKDKKDGHYTLR